MSSVHPDARSLRGATQQRHWRGARSLPLVQCLEASQAGLSSVPCVHPSPGRGGTQTATATGLSPQLYRVWGQTRRHRVECPACGRIRLHDRALSSTIAAIATHRWRLLLLFRPSGLVIVLPTIREDHYPSTIHRRLAADLAPACPPLLPTKFGAWRPPGRVTSRWNELWLRERAVHWSGARLDLLHWDERTRPGRPLIAFPPVSG